MEKKQRALEIVVKIVVAALTAFLTALGTTSCDSCKGLRLEVSWQAKRAKDTIRGWRFSRAGCR